MTIHACRLAISLAALAALLFAAGAGAQTETDLTGPWTLNATANVAGGVDGLKGTAVVVCVFEGDASVVQSGDQISGDAELGLVDGPTSECPPEMSAALDGTVVNDSIQMGMLAGGLGTADFQGMLTPSLVERPRKGEAVGTLNGAFQVTSGSFTNTTGTWNASPAPASVLEVPALTPAGLTLLVLILLGAGIFLLQRP